MIILFVMTLIVLPAYLNHTLRFAGPLFNILMQAAALGTARHFLLTKTTGKLSVLPYLSLFTNCFLWSYYGLLVEDLSILIANGSGVLAGLISTFLFQIYCSHTPFLEYCASLSVISLGSMYFAMHEVQMVGYIGCVLSIVLLSSPLATLHTVIQTKSTNSLPLSTSLASAASALSWSLYGLLVANDPMIYVPSALGLIPAALQLTLYIVYGLPRREKEKELVRTVDEECKDSKDDFKG